MRKINLIFLFLLKNILAKDIILFCKNVGVCVPFVQCPAHVWKSKLDICKFNSGETGICCVSGQNLTEPISDIIRSIPIDSKTIRSIARNSQEEMSNIRSNEVRLLTMNEESILSPASASYGHFRNSRLFNMADLSEVMDLASRALELAIATKTFKERQGLTKQQIEMGMLKQDLRPTPLGSDCITEPFCDLVPVRYRRIDGACNNNYHSIWGSLMTPYARLLPPNYQDGIWLPRLSEFNNQSLSSPRLISTTIFTDDYIPNYGYTLMVMQFGQFLSHDITQSIDATYPNGSAINCCLPNNDYHSDARNLHHACMPIEIPFDDHFYSHFEEKCMNFVRSVLVPNEDCTLGYAQQMNKITHFLDGSSIYGSSTEQTRELRTFYGGQLKVFKDFGRDLLPLANDPNACSIMEQGAACFTSGDTRTNQMISLVVLHTIFMREHNRIANELAKLNPHWNDETLFLETRQIVIAELQVIIYKEYLPVVIGNEAMEQFQLKLQDADKYAEDYDESVNPSVTNEFASATWRFGHSMVDGLLKVYGPKRIEEMISIPEVMFQPGRIRKKLVLDELLSTLTTEPIQEVDHSISETLTRYMFRGGNPFGVDLASLNIQRGRDHGLRSYNDYRQLVGLPKIKSFEEFGPHMSKKLKSVYACVNDIDLWVGGLLEDKVPGAIVGKTFRDIIADQFFRLKKGDKYFFENHPSINPGHFTPLQLVELRKVSMARIICDNSDQILLAKQAPNVFLQPGVPGNEFVECNNALLIARMNLLHWKEKLL